MDDSSPIPAGQKSGAGWIPIKKQKITEENRRAKQKYLDYFQENTILPILEKMNLSYISFDIKTRKFIGLKRDDFEEFLLPDGISGKYFSRRSLVAVKEALAR